MALLGTQLVITLVMVSVIQKLGPHYSLARWLLCSTGLYRYLYPTNEELKTLAGIQKAKKPDKKHRNGTGENGRAPESFHVAKSLVFEMETCPVVPLDLVHLRFWPEFQWLVDFSVYASGVYILTELSSSFINFKDEVNLSVVWCLLVVGFSFKVLLSLTRQYFSGEETGERSTVVVMAFSYLLIAMIILIVDESKLELGLDSAYRSFNQSAAQFMDRQGVNSAGAASKIVINFCLAVWCGLVGALFTFPGLRSARMHWDAVKYYKDRRLMQLVMTVSFVMPFLLTLLWIRPISRDYLTTRVFRGMTQPLFTRAGFETMRLILVVVAVVLRVCLMPLYLQSYLDMAARRVESLRKEAGRITNVELQKRIAAVYYYLCVVALQYVAPLLMCLFFTCLYKSLGGFSWTGTGEVGVTEECSLAPPTAAASATLDLSQSSVHESAQQISLALESLKQVFTVEVYRGVLGLMTWWSCFTWFTTSFMGFLYQSYFTQQV